MKTSQPVHLSPPLHLLRHHKATIPKLHQLLLLKREPHLPIQMEATQLPRNLHLKHEEARFVLD